MIAKRTIYLGAGLLLLIFALVITPIIVFGAANDSVTATFTLNSTPTIANVDFIAAGGAPTATLTPDNTAVFGVDFDVSHSAGMTDLLNVTIYIFDDSVHGGDFNTTAADGDELITILWIEATDTWSIDQGGFSEWTMQSPVDPGTGNASTTGDFKAYFDISWAAAASPDWNVSVWVFDDDGIPEYAFDSETAFVTMNANFDISFGGAISTMTWGNDIVPSSVNNSQVEAITIQIRANTVWETSIQATDFTGGAGHDIDTTLVLAWDQDNSGGGTSVQVLADSATIMDHAGAQSNTWDNQVRMSSETNETRSFFIFLSVDTGSWTIGQLYTTTITLVIQANT